VIFTNQFGIVLWSKGGGCAGWNEKSDLLLVVCWGGEL